MFFTWFIFLSNDIFISSDFDCNVNIDSIISGKWINIVNMFYLNIQGGVGEVRDRLKLK